jgi:hypothetical protein
MCGFGAATVASTDALHRGRSDFGPTYLTAQLWSSDHAAPLYDQRLQEARQRQISLDHNGYLPFLNPPMAAVVVAPLAHLDFATAYFIWAAIQAALILAALVIAARAVPWSAGTSRLAPAAVVAAVMATEVILVEVSLGQYDGPLCLGVALAYACWRSHRSLGAGLALGLSAGLAKPHLVLGLVAFMAGRRDWRALGGAAAGGATWLVATLAAVPAATIAAYPGGAFAGGPSTRPAGILGVYGPAATILGDGAAAVAVWVVAAVALVIAALWLGSRTRGLPGLEVALFGAVCAGLLLPPHDRYYDLVLLAPLLPPLVARLDDGRGIWPGPIGVALILGWLILGIVAITADAPGSPVASTFVLCPLLLAGVIAAVAGARRARTIAA